MMMQCNQLLTRADGMMSLSSIFSFFFFCQQEGAGSLFMLPGRAKPNIASQK